MHAPFPLKAPGAGRLRLALTLVLALIAALVALPGSASAASTICSSQTGTNGGNYYQMWTNGTGSACMTLNSGTSYSTSWSGVGDFVDGVGWNPGSNNTVNFSSSLNASGGTTLVSLYGWSTSPLVEYYIEENYSGSPNTAGTYMGQVTSDGGTYNIYEHQQVNQPSIQGTATFEQYLAIRTSPVSSGTITTQNFINAWASHGMNLGTLNYQILATESWGGGSGNDSVTVNSGSGSGGGTGGGGGSGSCTATLSAGSQGSNWYSLNVAVTGSSTWTVTMNLVAPAVVYSTSNVSATWPSQYVMVAKPNGNGNNFSVTISPNGQWTWPSVSCST
ncbi:glycoside hydrolase family 11 protein [Actinospica acidithermotolerans]|uniref:glycoside hydrolase family 11 protein n=1 Tax=Actinospica acidithermotolerans TaxID=2828514 RepID=UPI0027DE17A2|nr:glycoside hydrolase family 11 protein [Actinospica acidithermotolerans]